MIRPPETIGTLSEQWKWAVDEADEMLTYFLSNPWRRDAYDDDDDDADDESPSKRRCSSVAYAFRTFFLAPLYYFVRAQTAVFIMSGRRLHYIAGQHGPVHSPETRSEKEIRVWWIFPTDASFIVGALLALVDVIFSTITNSPHLKKLHSMLITVVLYSSIVASNFLFLHAMRTNNAILIKAFIAGNASLALALVLLCATEAFRYYTSTAAASETTLHDVFSNFYTWVLRGGFILLMVGMSATYFRLWFVYDPAGLRMSSLRNRRYTVMTTKRATKYHCASILAAFGATVLIAIMLIAAFSLDTDALWSALA